MGQQEIEAAMAQLNAPEAEPAKTDPQPAAPAGKTETPAAPAKADGGTPVAAKPQADAGNADAAKPEEDGKSADPAAPEKGGAWTQAFEAIKADLGERCSSAEQMRMQLADAHALYDICFGRAEPSALLELLKKDYPAAFQKVAAYFGGGSVEPAKPTDPVAAKVEEIDKWRQDQEQKAKESELLRRRQGVVDKFAAKVGELAKKAELDEEETAEYVNLISAEIGRDRAAVERLEKGDFRDVEGMFNARHTKLNERYAKRSEAAIAARQQRDRSIPKTPAGGSPPAPATAVRGSMSSRDARIAAATEALNQA